WCVTRCPPCPACRRSTLRPDWAASRRRRPSCTCRRPRSASASGRWRPTSESRCSSGSRAAWSSPSSAAPTCPRCARASTTSPPPPAACSPPPAASSSPSGPRCRTRRPGSRRTCTGSRLRTPRSTCGWCARSGPKPSSPARSTSTSTRAAGPGPASTPSCCTTTTPSSSTGPATSSAGVRSTAPPTSPHDPASRSSGSTTSGNACCRPARRALRRAGRPPSTPPSRRSNSSPRATPPQRSPNASPAPPSARDGSLWPSRSPSRCVRPTTCCGPSTPPRHRHTRGPSLPGSPASTGSTPLSYRPLPRC
ncbi:MAG: Transcriptional regulator, LysR family, partial [uncultured Nocardioides sp.]